MATASLNDLHKAVIKSRFREETIVVGGDRKHLKNVCDRVLGEACESAHFAERQHPVVVIFVVRRVVGCVCITAERLTGRGAVPGLKLFKRQ